MRKDRQKSYEIERRKTFDSKYSQISGYIAGTRARHKTAVPEPASQK